MHRIKNINSGRPNGQLGFTMLEVLIAVIILAIGLLGVASLQAKGLRFSHSSALRSQAVALSYDIVDKMRANRSWGISSLDGLANYHTFGSELPTSSTNCEENVCSQTQMATYDLHQWAQRLKNPSLGLPGGAGHVCVKLVNSYSDENNQIDGTAFPALESLLCNGDNDANATAALIRVRVTWIDDQNGTGTVSFDMETML